MVTHVNGFKLEVRVVDFMPEVRVSLHDGTVVVDTNRVSVTGLQKLPEVIETAASIALRELERAYDLKRIEDKPQTTTRVKG